MEFVDKGVVFDDDMPEVDFYRMAAFGMRDGPMIDLTPAKEELGEIRSGVISWFSRPNEGMGVRVLTSGDGENYELLENARFISNPEDLNESLEMYLRYTIVSTISPVFREQTPKLYEVVIVLSNREQFSWTKGKRHTLKWKGDN